MLVTRFQNSPVLRFISSVTPRTPLGFCTGNASCAVPVIVVVMKLAKFGGAPTPVTGGVLS